MKKTVFILTLIASISSFAQSNSLSTNMSKTSSGNSQKGFYIGADYMNISDVKIDYSFRGNGRSASGDTVGGTHIGMGGITLGYNKTPDRGFGFSAGARFLESFNRSEYEDWKIQMIIPEANLTLAVNSLLVIYAGLNSAVFTGSSSADRLQSRPGFQSGLGFRLTKNVAWNAGYTIINQHINDKLEIGTAAEVDVRYSGFNSNLTYTF
ncbi:MAG: outer membrane beta-barrel protein [Pseudobdellovibrionaceae bacterium]